MATEDVLHHENGNVISDFKGISLLVTTMSLVQLYFTINFFESLNIYTYHSEKFDSSKVLKKINLCIDRIIKFHDGLT